MGRRCGQSSERIPLYPPIRQSVTGTVPQAPTPCTATGKGTGISRVETTAAISCGRIMFQLVGACGTPWDASTRARYYSNHSMHQIERGLTFVQSYMFPRVNKRAKRVKSKCGRVQNHEQEKNKGVGCLPDDQ